MKRIFPIITVLIFMSLLGIIFFQILWIKQARMDKEKQFQDALIKVTGDAATDLAEEKENLSPLSGTKNKDIFFPLN
ncbi:MAG: hypothetical protein KGM98_08670, partial [Bacteroidota bacterium]|nr:hypothetical protein [Bacteroidota bacterium]